MKIKIPEWELEFSAARASGPGGQNVNKTATKVTLRFDVVSSKTLNSEQKVVVLKKLQNWINKEGEVVIAEQSSRSQWTNRQAVIKRLNDLIQEALKIEKERKETKTPKREKEKRIEGKKKRSEVKKTRRPVRVD